MAASALGQTQCVTLRSGEVACPAPDTRCVKDRYGEWLCSGPGGDAVLNLNGDPVCGAGSCIKDINGQAMCSKEPRGSAALDRYSKAVCASGCAAATAQACKVLTK